jgi:5-methylcytosine-specific restriction endonuclease McrA
MISITRPEFHVREVFLTCISSVDDEVLKQNYEDCIDLLEEAEADFIDKFTKHEIYKIHQKLTLSTSIGKHEMVKAYTYRMLHPTYAGRVFYQTILDSAPFGKCPLCSIRDADTLDHYLPKTKYPIFSVTPITLVPACSTCNKDKLTAFPKSSEDQTLHPYFDNVENDAWIKGSIIETDPISFNFSPSPPSHWADILQKRAISHFHSYKLNSVFAAYANDEFRARRLHLVKLFRLNPDELKKQLQDSHDSALEMGKNTWRVIMYEALLSNEWFLNGGFLNME